MAVLSQEEIEGRVADMDGWRHEDGRLVRELEFEDFAASVDFVNRITPPAEEMNHHQDLSISWNKVTLRLVTHSEGGVTDNDFELASRIDPLV